MVPNSEAYGAASVVRDGDDALLMSTLVLLSRGGWGGINEAGEGRREGAVSVVPDSINQLFLCALCLVLGAVKL